MADYEFPYSRSLDLTNLRGSVLVSKGAITVMQDPIVRSWAFESDIPNYTDIVAVGTRGMVPLNFQRGQLTLVVPTAKELLFTTNPTSWFPSGRITAVSSALPLTGALAEFAIWPLTAAGDPRDVMVVEATAETSAGVARPWNRHHATVVLPKRARYLGIGGKFKSLPPSETGVGARQHIRNVQAEVAPLSQVGPREFSDAREIQTVVRPDRVNLFPNPSFELNTAGFNGAVLGRTTEWASSRGRGTYSIKVGTSGAGRAVTPIGMFGLVAGDVCTLSVGAFIPVAHVGGSSNSRAIRAEMITAAGEIYAPIAQSPPFPNIAGVEHEVSLTFTVPAEAVSLRFSFYNGSATEGDVTYYDDILLEKGDAVRPFFDGGFGGDYVWEGTVGESRSFYYKNRAERYAALERTLKENIPMGLGHAVPKFGAL